MTKSIYTYTDKEYRLIPYTRGEYWVSRCGMVGRVVGDNIFNYKPRVNNCGYSRVSVPIKGKIMQKLVHRLVAQAFISNPHKKPQVNHLDGTKSNNHRDNLEWATGLENMRHASRIGLLKNTGRKAKVELDEDTKNYIYHLYLAGAFKNKLAEEYDIPRSYLDKILI